MAMKLKSQEVKGKIFDYIVSPSASANTNAEKTNGKEVDNSKQIRNAGPVFSIDDDQDLGELIFLYIKNTNVEVYTIQHNLN